MNKKDSGFAEKLLPVLLSTGIVFGLILLSGQLMDVLRTREAINQTARAYLLEMETIGYLPDSSARVLEKSLEEDCGLAEVSFAGTTILPASYGDKIQIVIEGSLKPDLQVAIPFLYKESVEWTIPIRICLISTAKH